jgi:hypothetical protein
VIKGLLNLLPGYGFFAAGFPRAGGGVLITTALFWVFAWPFAIPVHLAAWVAGCSVRHSA